MSDDRIDAATSAEPTSLHDDISAAYDEAFKEETTPEVKEETAVPEHEQEEQVDKPAEEGEVETPKDEEKVDDKPEIKAPASWKPEMREKFAELPDEVREEIMRVEGASGKAFRESAQARQIADNFVDLVKPYQEVIEQAGTTPFRAIQETLEVAKRLNTGTARQKAEVLGELFQVYGVDLNELNDVLTERVTAPKATPAEQKILDRLDRFEQSMRQQPQAVRNTPEEEEAVNRVRQFAADPKNEFFNDVSADMEMLLVQGRAKSIQEAYDKACRMNDSVIKVLEDRRLKAKSRATAGNVSVTGTAPKAKVDTEKNKSLREVLEDAFDEAENG